MSAQYWKEGQAEANWSSNQEGGSGQVHTFVLEKEQTHQSSIIDITIAAIPQAVDLTGVFQQFCPLRENKISIYDPEVNRFIPLSKIGAEQNGIIPQSLLEPKIIMIRFKRREPTAQKSESDSGIQSGLQSDKQAKQKKDRSRERTIGQAIQLVKRWRLVHLDSVKSGLKKISLADAAKSIGVSKKTLDDYYYQLRLGEFYCFDFANNLSEKVGILRAYVKEFKPDREEKNKNLRHPKNLKIIESFDLDLPNILKIMPQTPPSPMMEELKSPASFQSLSLQQDSHQLFIPKQNPFMKDVMESYQDKFFKNFEFLLDDPNDPFVQIDRNFKKKPFEEPNNDFFFF